MEETLRPEVAYFNDTSVSYRKEYDRVTPEGYSFRVRREKVLDMVPPKTRVVDIACGPGVMIRGLRSKNCDITCTDAAPEMIARIKEEHGEEKDLTAVVGDAYQLPFDGASYDVALAMGLIEYLEDEDRFLSEVQRILKNNGIFIITFPNYSSPWRAFNRIALWVRGLFRKRSSGKTGVRHREYSARRASALLTQHGFTTLETRYYNFKLVPYPLDRMLPRFTVAQSGAFERLDRSALRWLGTGFIIKARKYN